MNHAVDIWYTIAEFMDRKTYAQCCRLSKPISAIMYSVDDWIINRYYPLYAYG